MARFDGFVVAVRRAAALPLVYPDVVMGITARYGAFGIGWGC